MSGPTDRLLPLAELLPLSLQAGAPPPVTASLWVRNDRVTVRQILHQGTPTVYLEVRFPAGSLESLGGTLLGDADSVLVTVLPDATAYGFSLSPATLRFRTSALPTVTFSFARFADASVADGSDRYPTRGAYVAALDVWHEVTIDLWGIVRGSGPAGLDAVAGAVEAPGRYVLAAPR